MLSYLDGANRCYDNGCRLLRAAQSVLKYEKDYPITSNLLDTATEEFLKGIFCMFVHFGCITETAVSKVFRDHGAKAKLQVSILDGVTISGGSLMVNGVPITQLYDRRLDRHLRLNYMNERNFAAYVDRLPTDSEHPTAWQSPSDLTERYENLCAAKLGGTPMTGSALKKLIETSSIPFTQISFQIRGLSQGIISLETHVKY